MKKLISALMALLIVVGMMPTGTLAQRDVAPASPEPDSGSEISGGEFAYARGLNAEAMLFSERGDTIATLVVTDVERAWQDYAEYYEPTAGKIFVAVTFEITVESRGSLLLNPYTFKLMDGWGFVSPSVWMEAGVDADVPILVEDTDVASGETVEFMVVFEIFDDAPFGFFLWEPGFGSFVMFDLTGERI